MNGVNDSLLIAILLTLIFGAVSFYLYSRMSQTEKRLGLLENLLLQIKISTEASLEGPDSIEAISEPSPLRDDDVESIDAEEYSEMLKEIPMPKQEISSHESIDEEAESEKEEEQEKTGATPVLDVNYEAMSLAELKTLAKQKGHTGIQNKKKKELIDMLKAKKEKEGDGEEFGGVEIGENGFPVEMSSS